ncbi:hypothetical protein Tco_1283331 [Tanacetum coccineum]
MASMKYCDKHNQVGFLKKPEESIGFAEIVDFLKGSHIRYALTHNPTIHDSLVKQFWQTATALTLADGTLELRVTIDTLEYTITEVSVQSKLQLADASGISMLPNTEIFKGMGNMGPKSGGSDHFGSNLAIALICLSMVDSLETELKQTKLTMGKALVKLVKKVKKMEDVLKRRHVVLPDSEDEDAEISSKQGRNLQEEGLDEMVRNMMKDKSEVFKTPTQGKTSGEEDINPTTLEAAKTLSKVASQRSKSVDKGKRYKRIKESKGKDINIGFEDISTVFEDISIGFEDISTGFEDISTGFEDISTGFEEVRLAEEEELTEQQKKRKAQVQFKLKFFTEEEGMS